MLRLIILLILAGGIHSLTPTTAMATAPADSTRITLRIMSFNLRYGTVGDGENAWEFRRQLVRDTILAFSPDVLGTQECLAFQAEFLQGQFPDYGFVGAGRDDGDRAGEMCAIFFRRDRYDPLASGHFWLSETPDRPGSKSWDSALPRMVSWVKLRAKGDTSLTFCIFNTHFDHRGRTARRESARLLRRQALAIAQGSPLIFTGDFNAPANLQAKGPYRELISSATPSDPVSDPGFWTPTGSGIRGRNGTRAPSTDSPARPPDSASTGSWSRPTATSWTPRSSEFIKQAAIRPITSP